MFSRLSSRVRSSFDSIILNRFTVAFFTFSFIFCFSQVLIQAFLFTLDSANLDVVSRVVLQGGISPNSRNMTFLDGSSGHLRLHMCDDVPFLQNSPCFDVFDSGSEEIASCPLSKFPSEETAMLNWEKVIKITTVLVNSSTVIKIGFSNGRSINLNHQCIQILTFPQQTLSNFRREDITFIFLQFWLFAISFCAVTHASVPHIFAVLATRLLNTAWAAYSIWRTLHVEEIFQALTSDSPCCIANIFAGYFRGRFIFVMIDLVFNCAALIMASYLPWVLLQAYSRQSLKYIGAPKHIDRINKFFMAVLACLQLEAFVLIAALGLWLDVLFNTAIRRISDPANFYVYTAAIVITMAILVPWISMGWYAIRRERKKTMMLFLFISLALMTGWAIMFYSQVYRWTFMQWPYLGCFTVASFILLIATMLLGAICRANFGKGHAEYLRAEAALSSSNFSPDVFNKQHRSSSTDLESKLPHDSVSLSESNFNE